MELQLIVDEDRKYWASFYVYQDQLTEDYYWGDSLDHVKENMIRAFMESPPQKEDGSFIPVEEINAKLENIKEDQLQKINVAFRKPNFGRALDILSEAYQDASDQVNPKLYTLARLGHLLVDWDITHHGEKAPLEPEFMSKVNPNVMAGILHKLGTRIPHYRQL